MSKLVGFRLGIIVRTPESLGFDGAADYSERQTCSEPFCMAIASITSNPDIFTILDRECLERANVS